MIRNPVRQSRVATSISLLLLIMVVQPRCAPASARTACPEAAQPHPHTDVVIVNPSSICVPEGVFVAVRKPHRIGAVRFTGLRDLEGTGLEGCSRFEIHMRDDRMARLRTSVGAVSSFGSAGAHPFVVERGNQTIAAPGFSVRYMHPGCISLLADRELEVAPTPWRTAEDVDLGDARLHWYSFDASGARHLIIPLHTLE